MAEADESDGSFLRLAPVIAVVTNVEAEHLDHWGSYEALLEGFAAFANRVPFFGAAVVGLDDPGVRQLLPRLTRRTVTYGFSVQADFVATEVEAQGSAMRFHVRRGGDRLGEVYLPLPGRHNVQNALACLAVALEADVPFRAAADALESFRGVERRFETKGSVAGIRVVDDYGHHPTEIRATLAAARGLHSGRIVVVFQPHRYTRTHDLFDAFTDAFHDADRLIVTGIYAAGEEKIPGVESAALVEAIRARGHRGVELVADLEQVPEVLVPELREGDLVITLGAGQRDSPRAEAARGPRGAASRDRRAGRPRGARAPPSATPCASTCRSRASPRSAWAAPPTRSPRRPTARRWRRGLARLRRARAAGDACSATASTPWCATAASRASCCACSALRGLAREPAATSCAEAGVTHATLTRHCVEHGLAGLEFARGHPGHASAAGSR